MLFMYALVGPFAIVKLYAKNLMHQAYGNSFPSKLIAFVVSLAVASQTAFEYRHRSILLWSSGAFLALLLNYWYLIPLLLIYVVPVLRKSTKYWMLIVERICTHVIRPLSTKFRQTLPSVWTFESSRKLWPIESVCFMLNYGSIGPALYCGYAIYRHLYFGTSFNLCIAIAITLLLIRTLWQLLEAIDRDLHPFLFMIILQYYILPIQSFLNIPLTLLVTTFLFPFLNRLLTSDSVKESIQNLKMLNYRTFLEANQTYKQFFTEFVNLVVSSYFTIHVLIICLTSDVPWLLTMAVLCFLPTYLFTHLTSIIAMEPNTTMFLFSSFVLSRYVLNSRLDQHFIYKYFLLIMILTLYFALIYPLLYHILRRLTIRSAQHYGLHLRSWREEIYQQVSHLSDTYLRTTYIHDPSKFFILHLCNILIALVLLTLLPLHLVPRLLLAPLSYLLIGRLLLTRGLEVLATLISFCASISAGAAVYAHYDYSLLLTMSIVLITYVSTMVVAFPTAYRLLQGVCIYFPWMTVLNQVLQTIFTYSWSYFDVYWTHIRESFDEVKRQIEQSRLNRFRRPRTVQQTNWSFPRSIDQSCERHDVSCL